MGNKYFFNILFVLALVLFSTNFVSCAVDPNYDDGYDFEIVSPLDVELDKQYSVEPDDVIVRDKDSLEIIGGQALLSKYIFKNKLKYTIETDFELDLDTDKSSDYDNYKIYFANAVSRSECSKSKILQYNDEDIIVIEDDDPTNKKVLCYIDNDEKLSLKLKPGYTTKFVLIVTDISVPIGERISYDVSNKVNVISTKSNSSSNNDSDDENTTFGFVGTNKTDDSDNTIRFINSNYDTEQKDDYNLAGTVSGAKDALDNIVDTSKAIKSKATGLVSFKPSSWGIMILGLFVVIIVSIVVSNKIKEKNPFGKTSSNFGKQNSLGKKPLILGETSDSNNNNDEFTDIDGLNRL